MKPAVKALIKALDDSNISVRRAAAESLGNLGGKPAVKALFDTLIKENQPIRIYAVRALVKTKDTNAVKAISKGLLHPNLAVRFAFVSEMANYLDSEVTPDKVLQGRVAGWFVVRDSYDGFEVANSVRDIVKTLTTLSASETNRRVREYAVKALTLIQQLLSQIRLEVERELNRKRVIQNLNIQEDEEDELDDDGWGGPGPKSTTHDVIASEPVKLEKSREELLADQSINTSLLNEPESRYADITFYKIQNKNSKGDRINRVPLRSGERYMLEVAVRVKPLGIPVADGELRQSIYEPKQSGDVTIFVTAEGDGFDVENPTQTLILPPKGDSKTNASFIVTPTRQTDSALDLANIRVRLYYNFNLLEEVIVRAEVVGKFESDGKSRLGLAEPVYLQQSRREREYIDLDEVKPRAMHIDITKRGAHFFFSFAFFNEEAKVEFSAPARISAADLESDVITLRNILFDIATSETFTKQLEGDEEEFVAITRKLALAGSNLWIKLFRREIESPLYKIGQWLKANPLEDNSIIQISLDAEATDFVFPWSLIYDEQIPKEDYIPPNPKGFWGMRYCIEQQLPNVLKSTDAAVEIQDKLRIQFVLWEHFRNTELQNKMMRRFEERSGGKLYVSSPPINRADICRDMLREATAHILYFYTHGYTRHRMADIGNSTDLDLFLRKFEVLEKESNLRERYKHLYDDIKSGKFEPDRSWVEPTYGRIYLDQLYYDVGEFLSQPLVILNMCESAQITPSLSDSFIHFFLNRGAKSVIGTECPMTIEFAHPFAEKFLTDILAGMKTGEALLNTRRYFMNLKNPLGLAYTLFGSALCYFNPPLFTEKDETQGVTKTTNENN